MTEKTQPTDAELKAMWQPHAADIGGIFYYARAVLAKWGQPAQAAEPVAYSIGNTLKWHEGKGLTNAQLFAAPQPSTAAQGDALSDAVRVPLDSLHADAAYLMGRLREGSMPYARVIEIIRERIDAAKAAIRASAAHGQAPATRPVAREPLPKFLALKFHARRDKKATVTLLFPGHEAADAWVRGIKGDQHGTESST